MATIHVHMQVPALQHQWPHMAASLMLEPMRVTSTYRARLFPVGLAECQFEEYAVDTGAYSAATVAPLFSSQWVASQSHMQSQHRSQDQANAHNAGNVSKPSCST